MGIFDCFRPSVCPECEKYRKEVAELQETIQVQRFVSPAILEAAARNPTPPGKPSLQRACILYCRFALSAEQKARDVSETFQVLNSFYSFISGVVSSFKGVIDRYWVQDVVGFFYGENAQTDGFKAAQEILKQCSSAGFPQGVTLFGFMDDFLCGAIGNANVRMEFTSLGHSVFDIYDATLELPNSDKNRIVIQSQSFESLQKLCPNLIGVPFKTRAGKSYQLCHLAAVT